MIQLVFDSKDKITPSWEDKQERLVFRLSLTDVKQCHTLHQEMEETGAPAQDDEAMGVVALRYEDESPSQVQLILELPDDVWDNLANWADDLLDEGLWPDDTDWIEDEWDEE